MAALSEAFGLKLERWQDRGIILQVRPHGESSTIIQTLTAGYGKAAGLVRGGQSKRLAPVLQLGNGVQLVWTARLAENLGRFDIELEEARAARFLSDPLRLLALQSFCAVLAQVLPERETMPQLYSAAVAWLDTLDTPHWAESLVGFELGLLGAMGYGLDLSCCAATGETEDLVYVSPRSGRAVSRAAGAPFAERLLVLPGFLRGRAYTSADTCAGLKLTGYFIEKHLCHAHNRPLPAVRIDLVARLAQAWGEADKQADKQTESAA